MLSNETLSVQSSIGKFGSYAYPCKQRQAGTAIGYTALSVVHTSACCCNRHYPVHTKAHSTPHWLVHTPCKHFHEDNQSLRTDLGKTMINSIEKLTVKCIYLYLYTLMNYWWVIIYSLILYSQLLSIWLLSQTIDLWFIYLLLIL